MPRRILLSYEAASSGHLSLLEGIDLEAWRGARLQLMAVVTTAPILTVDPDAGGLETLAQAAESAHSRVVLDAQVERLRALGFEADGVLSRGPAVRSIVEQVRTSGADLLVVGHVKGRGWAQRWWQGCLPKALLDESPCNVLVVMKGEER